MKHLLTFIFLFASGLSQAQSKSVHIILSSNQSIYQEASTIIQNDLALLGNSLEKSIHLIDNISTKNIAPDDLIVTLGDRSAEEIQSLDIENPVIYAFVERDIVRSIAEPTAENPWAALVINQPLQRLVSVADNLVSDSYKNKIVIVVSENNTFAFSEIENLRPLNNGVLEIVKVPTSKLASKIVTDEFFNAGALVALHDNAIWSGKSAKLLLYQAFNYKIPVIGYSKKFLTAGALISVFSPVEDIANHTAMLIHQWSTTGDLKETGIIYSAAYLDVNTNIARVLRLPVPKLESLIDED